MGAVQQREQVAGAACWAGGVGAHAGGRILAAASSGRRCCGRLQRPARLLHLVWSSPPVTSRTTGHPLRLAPELSASHPPERPAPLPGTTTSRSRTSSYRICRLPSNWQSARDRNPAKPSALYQSSGVAISTLKGADGSSSVIGWRVDLGYARSILGDLRGSFTDTQAAWPSVRRIGKDEGRRR